MGNVRLIQNDNSRNVIFVDFELFNSPALRFRGACLVPVKPIEDRSFFINELQKPTLKRTGFVVALSLKFGRLQCPEFLRQPLASLRDDKSDAPLPAHRVDIAALRCAEWRDSGAQNG